MTGSSFLKGEYDNLIIEQRHGGRMISCSEFLNSSRGVWWWSRRTCTCNSKCCEFQWWENAAFILHLQTWCDEMKCVALLKCTVCATSINAVYRCCKIYWVISDYFWLSDHHFLEAIGILSLNSYYSLANHLLDVGTVLCSQCMLAQLVSGSKLNPILLTWIQLTLIISIS